MTTAVITTRTTTTTTKTPKTKTITTWMIPKLPANSSRASMKCRHPFYRPIVRPIKLVAKVIVAASSVVLSQVSHLGIRLLIFETHLWSPLPLPCNCYEWFSTTIFVNGRFHEGERERKRVSSAMRAAFKNEMFIAAIGELHHSARTIPLKFFRTIVIDFDSQTGVNLNQKWIVCSLSVFFFNFLSLFVLLFDFARFRFPLPICVPYFFFLSFFFLPLLLFTHVGESPVRENLFPPIFWHN